MRARMVPAGSSAHSARQARRLPCCKQSKFSAVLLLLAGMVLSGLETHLPAMTRRLRWWAARLALHLYLQEHPGQMGVAIQAWLHALR